MFSSLTQLRLGKEQWSVYRRYEQFLELHKHMKMKYPEVSEIYVLSQITPSGVF